MINLPSAGKIGLAWKCLGSVLLPQVKEEAGPEAEEGKRKHAILEKFFKSGRKDKPTDPADSELCERASTTVGRADAEWSEFGLAVNPDGRHALWSRRIQSESWRESTGELLRDAMVGMESGGYGGNDKSGRNLVAHGDSDGGGVHLGRTESVDRSDWFVAVADLIQWHGASRFSVYDWKSSSWATDPKYNWQLLLPAVYLWLSLDRPSDFKCELGIIYIAKPTDSGVFERTPVHIVNSDECDKLLGLLGRLRLRILRESQGPGVRAGLDSVTLYEGKHCDHCPARHRCPAKVGALAAATEALFLGIKPNDIGLVKVSRALVDSAPQIRKMEINILKEHGGELDLGDGRVAVLTEKNGKYKVYTRKNVKEISTGSNAAKDDSSGAESE